MPETHKVRDTETVAIMLGTNALETEMISELYSLKVATLTSRNKDHINFIHSKDHMFVYTRNSIIWQQLPEAEESGDSGLAIGTTVPRG